MLQGTRDTRRRALTAGRQSSLGEAPGSAHGSAAARSAPSGHRASCPAAAAARSHPGLPPAPPPRETCTERRGSRGAHWPDGAGRAGTGRDGAETPLKGSPALRGRRRSLSPPSCSGYGGLVAGSVLPHPCLQPAQSRDPTTGCRDLSVLPSDPEHRSIGRARGSCLESLEPPQELARRLQQQGSRHSLSPQKRRRGARPAPIPAAPAILGHKQGAPFPWAVHQHLPGKTVRKVIRG